MSKCSMSQSGPVAHYIEMKQINFTFPVNPFVYFRSSVFFSCHKDHFNFQATIDLKSNELFRFLQFLYAAAGGRRRIRFIEQIAYVSR